MKQPNSRFFGELSHPGYSLDTLYKIYELENRELVQEKSIHIKKLVIIKNSIHILKRHFLPLHHARLAGTKLHLSRRGFVYFVVNQRFHIDFPGRENFRTHAYV